MRFSGSAALGAVQLLDEALNDTWSDLDIGQKMLFLDERMLELLAKRCGFGPCYYSLDKAGQGIRTATEVASDNSELMRNVVKHELAISPAIERICEAVIALGRTVHGHALPDVAGRVRVVFDDSIIEDTEAQRRRDREEVSAGLMKPWEYRVKWNAEDEETARAMTKSADVLDDATL